MGANACRLLAESKFRSRSSRIAVNLRRVLKSLAPGTTALACKGGMDGIAELIVSHFGKNVWARALFNMPDSWEVRFASANHLAICFASPGQLVAMAFSISHSARVAGGRGPCSTKGCDQPTQRERTRVAAV